jgi:prefoldin subunit 5
VGTAQTIVEMGEAVNALQQETAAMQAQVDSLSAVVARQDTVIRQIAGMAGVPLPVR